MSRLLEISKHPFTSLERWGAKALTRCRGLTIALTVSIASIFATVSAVYAADPQLPPPPLAQTVDANGVDLTVGTNNGVVGDSIWQLPDPSISTGQLGQGGLVYTPHESNWAIRKINWDGNIKHDNPSAGGAGDTYVVTVNGETSWFYISGTVFIPTSGKGETLSLTGSVYTYTRHDGTVITFNSTGSTFFCGVDYCMTALMSTVTYPSGEALTFYWRTLPYDYHLQSITNNLGNQLKVEFSCDTPGSGCYVLPIKARAINNAVEYCNPTANNCSGMSISWPTLDFTSGVTDPMGNTTSVTSTSTSSGGVTHWTTTYSLPSGRHLTYKYDKCATGCDPNHLTVSDGADPSHPWQYQFTYDTTVNFTTTAQITDPLGHVRVVVSYAPTGQILTDTLDPSGLNLTTTYTYGGNSLISRITYPEGNYTNYTYDSRSDLIEVRQVSKTPGTPSDIVTSAVYPSTCTSSNFRVCAKPTSITDADGNVTDYTYDTAHGGILTAQGPAVGGVRPLTNYTYQSLYAWYKNSAGTIVQAATPVYRLVSTSTCKLNVGSCGGTANEVVATANYTSGSSSVATNLLPASTSKGAGNGSLTATVQSTYDNFGNVSSTTGPASGDTKNFQYDANRQDLVTSLPDPDGGGALLNPATRNTYNVDGQLTKVEQGTMTSGTGWGSFSTLTQHLIGYDSYSGLKSSDTSQMGGVSQSVTQYSYDLAGNLTCTAVRQNSAVFGSLPSACSQSTLGSNGPDQISYNTYDNANRLITTQRGYGTSSPIVALTNAYTNNSQLDWIEDGSGNRSDYTYDGMDRRIQLNYPSKTTAHTASGSDYETYSFDPNGNLTSERLRSSDVVGFTYDALNRLTIKDLPGGTSNDVYYGYDYIGNLLYAHYVSAGGSGIDYTYDALSRKLTETSYSRTVTSAYDIAGNRTRLTYPDSNYVDYTFTILNMMLQAKLNGSTTLATYSYDNLGRETGLTRGNSTSTSMTYNSTSQNWSLAQTMASSGQNVTYGLSYTPATQISQRTISNSSYAFGSLAPSHSYVSNGLNQYDSVSGNAFTYDSRGNLTSDGSRAFAYDLSNRMTSVSGSASMTLTYDPVDRMQQTASSSTQQYLYDGDQLIAEYNTSGTLLRRYVPGAGVDETLVWYEGTAFSTPSWLHTDQQGSVIAVTDASGAAVAYSYSATGEPAGGPVTGSTLWDHFNWDFANWAGQIPWSGPRFRYTGQAALYDVQLYYYKARMYDPVLGRFLQSDPIGYDGGTNLYEYAGNDSVNASDPSGLLCGPQDNYHYENGQLVYDGQTFGFDCSLDDGGRFALGGSSRDGRNSLVDSNATLRSVIIAAPSSTRKGSGDCLDSSLSGILNDPAVIGQMANAFWLGISTRNNGIQGVPSNGSEYAFYAGHIPLFGTYVGQPFTSHQEHFVDIPKPGPLLTYFASDVTAIHTHQSPLAGPGLSPADIDLAFPYPRGYSVNMVAVGRRGAKFCKKQQ